MTDLFCCIKSTQTVMKIHKVLDSDADEEKEDNVLIDRVSKMNFKSWKSPKLYTWLYGLLSEH